MGDCTAMRSAFVCVCLCFLTALAVADHEQDVPAGVQALLQEGATAGKISVDVTGQGVPGQKSGFIWIPNFVMNHMAQELNMRNRMKCEALCLKNKECRWYSWRQKDKLCVVSRGTPLPLQLGLLHQGA